MTVEYDQTLDDVVAFSMYHNRHSRTARRQFWLTLVLPALIWLGILVLIWRAADRDRGQPLQTFIALLPLFVGPFLYALIFPWFYRRWIRKTVIRMFTEGTNRGMLGPRSLTIAPEGISEKSELNQSSTSWSAVERVASDSDRAYIYATAVSAFIIPRRAFPDPSAFDQFIHKAAEYHRQTAPPAPSPPIVNPDTV